MYKTKDSRTLPDGKGSIEKAVERALNDGCRTADLAAGAPDSLTCEQMTEEILKRL